MPKQVDFTLMLVLIGAIASLEMIGIFNARFVTITQIIKQYMPISVRLMIVVWLFWHFIVFDILQGKIK